MRTIYTKEEMQECLKNEESTFYVGGELEQLLLKNAKKKELAKKLGIGSLILAGACAIAIPFTGGASAIPTIAALGFTAGSGAVAITTAELLIIGAAALGALGIITFGYKTIEVHKTEDGKTIVMAKR